jgi:hypothetical protein
MVHHATPDEVIAALDRAELPSPAPENEWPGAHAQASRQRIAFPERLLADR